MRSCTCLLNLRNSVSFFLSGRNYALTFVLISVSLVLGGCPFSRKAASGGGATTTVTNDSKVLNHAPVAMASSFTVIEDTPTNATLNATDADGNTLTYSIVNQGSKGTVSITGSTTGAVAYTPNFNANGTDTFTFRTTDSSAFSNTATVTVTITPVNDAPTATAQSVTTDQNTAKAITLSGADVDGDSLTYTVVGSPSHGALTGTAPNLTYTPTGGYYGADSFTFKVNDSTVDSATTATISITVNQVFTAPVANASSLSALEGTATNGTVTATDADSDPLTYSKVADPSHGTVTVNPDGSYTYTGAAGYYGADSFTFRAYDGGLYSNTATVSVTVSPILTISGSQANLTVTTRFGYTIGGTCTRTGITVNLSLARGGTTVTGTAVCNGTTYSGTIATGYQLTDGAVVVGAEYASSPLASRSTSITKNSGCTGNGCDAYLDNSGASMSRTPIGISSNSRFVAFNSSSTPDANMLGEASGTVYLRDRTYALTYRADAAPPGLGGVYGDYVSPGVSDDGTKLLFYMKLSSSSSSRTCTDYADVDGNGIFNNIDESCDLYACDSWTDNDADSLYTEGVDTCNSRSSTCASWVDDGDGIFEDYLETCNQWTDEDTNYDKYTLRAYNRTNSTARNLQTLEGTHIHTTVGMSGSDSGTHVGVLPAKMTPDGSRVASGIVSTAYSGSDSTSAHTLTGHQVTYGGSISQVDSVFASPVSYNYGSPSDQCPNSGGNAYNSSTGGYLQSINSVSSSDVNYTFGTIEGYSETSTTDCDVYSTTNCTSYTDSDGNGIWSNTTEICTGSSCSDYTDNNLNGFYDEGTDTCNVTPTCTSWSDDGDGIFEAISEGCNEFSCDSSHTSYTCNGSNSSSPTTSTLSWP